MSQIKTIPRMVSKPTSFCPGCGHGTVTRLLAEIIEEIGYEKKSITTMGVGCCWNINQHWDGDKLQSAHGRAASTATGVKIARPDVLSLTYQGDGDAYVIGLSETVNAAYRNTPITAIVINNNNFAMTGGQMSWTTLPGQITTTSVKGRNPVKTGYPLKLPEFIAGFEEIGYVARGSVHTPQEINKLKGYLRNAIEAQKNGEGYSLVEVLSPCPTNWRMNTEQSLEWMRNEVLPYYTLGELRERKKDSFK